MTSRWMLFTLCSLSISHVLAQITITESSLAGIGTSLIKHGTGGVVPIDVGLPGENQTWDLSDLGFQYAWGSDIISPEGTPLGELIPDADFCRRDEQATGFITYYFRRDPGQLIAVGSVSGLEDTTAYPYDPFGIELPLPLSYEAPTWTTLVEYYLEFDPGFGVTFRDSVVKTVDGWGLLITEYGTFQTLRMFVHSWGIMTLTGMPADTFEGVSYEWLDVYGNRLALVGSIDPDPEFEMGYAEIAEVVNVVAVEYVSPVVIDHVLLQNYPNPFNSSTQIVYNLPNSAHVSVVVYDLLGREIISLSEGPQQIGSHRITWDGRAADGLSVASGVYVYQIKTPNFTDAKKMVLIR